MSVTHRQHLALLGLHRVATTASKSDDSEAEGGFHQFPVDTAIAAMTAEDIAQCPASMQYEIMQKRRELLRHKTRPSFLSAARDPKEYAQVQMKAFLATSKLNRKIQELRKETADEFNRSLAAENNVEGALRRRATKCIWCGAQRTVRRARASASNGSTLSREMGGRQRLRRAHAQNRNGRRETVAL